ncbi:ABC transporter ATP-binding protein [Gordonibacter massiliensis (ex Traore et al. 2017)]|uniref:ABC transporter ATP-binding protein n=1 Tax=Gordonibacter massiliensis (ex Traore et al. 2017) TaxID=1841863 RepID=UPI001C8BC02F|nr:ABC transporter ATP-binding protein [Gordonibacter massiliensis (ex Traore et al. 2017)]MBX9035280.1 ABC transporter ATP-binding protein [Gordonibacter massiliensis (ex Traore et al. 2017)]
MDTVIETKGLTKRYGRTDVYALRDVDVRVRRGDIFGVVGDNGAGKTTLFKLLCGLAFPTAGELRLFDAYAPHDLERQRARVGAIIEQPGFYPALSVEKNLECCRIQKGVPGKDAVERVLDVVGLAYAKRFRCRELSMGMKQRLGLAMALLGEPEVLILDEPTNGLDPSGIVEMRTFLQRLNREKGITVVVSSHHLAELEQLATVYAFLSRGRLVEQVSARALQERCADCIDIGVSDPAGFTVLLERELHHECYQVLPDGIVRIFDPSTGIEAYSGLASGAGMDIYKLERRKTSLEQYYLEMKEKGAA